MKPRILLPMLFAVIPFLITGCNRAENGGGHFAAGRTPTLQFANNGGDGCADVFLFKATTDQREYLCVSADKEKLNLPALGSKEFDLAAAPEGLRVTIDLWPTAPKHTPYCNCVSSDSTREATWTAKSGKVTITLHDFVKHPGGPRERYKASVKLENVVFEDDAGRKTTLKEEVITEVVVGWYAG